MKAKRNSITASLIMLLFIISALIFSTLRSYANDILIKEGLESISVQTSFYNLSLDKSRNYTVSHISLKKGTGRSLLDKSGISYYQAERRRYQKEYSGIGFLSDGHHIQKRDDRVNLVFSSHNADFSITKTYTIFKYVPFCGLQYHIKARAKNVRIGPASFPTMYFPLYLDNILYPIKDGSNHTAKLVLKNGKICNDKVSNYWKGKHFPKRWYAMASSNTGEAIAILLTNHPDIHSIFASPSPQCNEYMLDFLFNGRRLREIPSGTEINIKYYMLPFKADRSSISPHIEGLINEHLESEIYRLRKSDEYSDLVTVLAREKNLSIWAAPAGIKLSNDLLQTEPGKTGKVPLKLSGARGESVSFQLAFKAEHNIDELSLTFSDLKNEDLGSISNTNISSQQVGHVYLKDLFMDGKVGLTPDPLVPKNHFSIQTDMHTAVLVKIKIPDSPSPGDYIGKINVNAESGLEIEYFLRVWDFQLPRSPSLRTAFELYPWELPQETHHKYLKAFLDNMSEHRISAVNVAYPRIRSDAGRLKIDTKNFDEITEYALDNLGMNTVFMPYTLFGVHDKPRLLSGEKPMTHRWQNFMEQYLKFMVPHMKHKGWHHKVLYFLWDEPYPYQNIYDAITRTANFVIDYDPDAQIYVSASNSLIKKLKGINKGLLSAVFAINIDNLTATPDRPTWISLDGACAEWIGTDLVKPRMLPWIAWAYSLDGLEQWSVNAWDKQKEGFSEDTFSFRSDVIDYSNKPVSASRFLGVLLYPGEDGNPLNSLRWESLADGMEDYEYLYRLEKMTREGKIGNSISENDLKQADEALQEIRNAIFSRNGSPISLQKLLQLRKRLGEINDRLADRKSS